MIKGYQRELLNTYDKIRSSEQKALKTRRDEIQGRYPEILRLDNQVMHESLKLPIAILQSKGDEAKINEIKDTLMDLRARKCEMLVSKGYPADYLDLHYRCVRCQDTGYIGVKQCKCAKNFLIKLYYKDSDLEDLIRDNNFSNFDLNLFSAHKIGNEKYSPRRNIQEHLDFITNYYLPNFDSIDTNLLFFGNPGSGKSYLSYCISKALLDSGFLVVYKTSEELINCLRDIRFNNNRDLETLLIDCDLLIVDDLGTEQINDFSITEMFNILNKKLLKKKKMLISTNLTLPDITQMYSERMASRLIGNFKLCKFFSEDIRIKINLEKYK
ncbi:MAG: ATP-binding protein [Clostridium sp.]